MPPPTTLSPTDRLDAVWHMLLLNPQLYKSINDALGGEMINHNPEGRRDVAARNERARRTLEMYKTVFVTPAIITSSLVRQRPAGTSTTLTILTFSGKDISEIEFDNHTTVEILKRMIQKIRTGIPMDSFYLRYRRKNLDDNRLVNDVKKGAKIYLIPRTRGC